MKLNQLTALHLKSPIRVGRGIGSGKGKTCGSGHKGQKSRSGVALKGFEGGQMPLYRRLPKRGFTSRKKKSYNEITLTRLQEAIDAKLLDPSDIQASTLKKAGLITKLKDGVRILGKGPVRDTLICHVAGISKPAREAIEARGGAIQTT